MTFWYDSFSLLYWSNYGHQLSKQGFTALAQSHVTEILFMDNPGKWMQMHLLKIRIWYSVVFMIKNCQPCLTQSFVLRAVTWWIKVHRPKFSRAILVLFQMAKDVWGYTWAFHIRTSGLFFVPSLSLSICGLWLENRLFCLHACIWPGMHCSAPPRTLEYPYSSWISESRV